MTYLLSLHLVYGVRNLIVPRHATALRELVHANCRGIPVIVFFVAPLFAAIPLGALLCNAVAWLIPPARRAFVAEARGVWHASFREAQRDLLAVARLVVPLGWAAALVGALVIRCPR